MKNQNKKIYSCVIVFTLLLATTLFGLPQMIVNDDISSGKTEFRPIFPILYQIRSSIVINGNQNFVLTAKANDWPGNGTQTNPIIINGSLAELSISNTSLFFIISECQISGEKYGIFFHNVSNAVIRNCIITNSPYGVFLNNSHNCDISGNHFSNCPYGYYETHFSSLNRIRENNFTNISETSIFIAYSERGVVRENNIKNSGQGVDLLDSHNISIVANTIVNNQGGIGVWGLYACGSFFPCLNISLRHNTIQADASPGISLGIVKDCLISHNSLIRNNGSGIEGEIVFNCTFSFNTLHNNLESGLFLSLTNDSLIMTNNVSFNTHYGLYLLGNSNQVNWNDFINNGKKPQAYSSLGNNISYNYWSDGSTSDKDCNGLIDNSYLIASDTIGGVEDPTPLLSPIDRGLTLPPPVIILPTVTDQPLSGVVEIDWIPSVSFYEVIRYSVHYSQDGGLTLEMISEDLVMTSYFWDTSTLPDGANYFLKIVATTPTGITGEATIDTPFVIQNFQRTTSFHLFLLLSLLSLIDIILLKRR